MSFPLQYVSAFIYYYEQVPGNCVARCVHAASFQDRIRNLSRVVIASVQLSAIGHPHLAHCGEPDKYVGDNAASAVACAPWDGSGLYFPGSDVELHELSNRLLVVSEDTPRPLFAGGTVQSMTPAEEETCCMEKDSYIGESPALVAIREMCRMVHASSYESSTAQLAGGEISARKQCIISIGGHEDWTAIGSEENALKIADLLSKLVRYTFADGVDLNFDHLGEISRFRALAAPAEYGMKLTDEYMLFAILVNRLRTNLDELGAKIAENAEADLYWLQLVYAKSPKSDYFLRNKHHLKTIILERKAGIEQLHELRHRHARYEPPGRLLITWTARLNAFVPQDHPVNYARAMTSLEKASLLSEWFVEPELSLDDNISEEDSRIVGKKERSASALNAATGYVKKIASWFRPKPRSDKKRRLSKAPLKLAMDSMPNDELLDIVHGEMLEDNEGLKVWPLISASVDEVLTVAHLQHITDPHPHSEYTSAASSGHLEEAPLADDDRFIPGEHTAMLNLTAIAMNFINIGKIDPSKLRIIIEPYHFVPGTGLFNPLEFNAGINHIKRHQIVKYVAWTQNVVIPDLTEKQENSQQRQRRRLLSGHKEFRSLHPDGYLALLNTKGYVFTRQLGQRLAPVFAFEWRSVGTSTDSEEL